MEDNFFFVLRRRKKSGQLYKLKIIIIIMIYFECVFTELKKSLFISCLYKTMKNYQIILIFFALATFIVTKKKKFH